MNNIIVVLSCRNNKFYREHLNSTIQVITILIFYIHLVSSDHMVKGLCVNLEVLDSYGRVWRVKRDYLHCL